MEIFKKIKTFASKSMVRFRRFKKSHPIKLWVLVFVFSVIVSQGMMMFVQYTKQTAARDYIEDLPKITLQNLNTMSERGQVKKVISHEIMSGSFVYPEQKSYLEIVNVGNKSFAWERATDSMLEEEFGKMMFKNSLKTPVVFETGNTLVKNTFSNFIGLLAFFLMILLLMTVGQSLVTEVIGGASFKAQKPDLETTLDDVIGYDDVKRQLRELKDQLLHSEKYQAKGVIPPKGILFTGDPGVGKTMMAKAIANEIGADFFTATGADFAEMYVGVGPKRVRSLFRQARMSAVSVIFIDEIDALGSRNTMGNDTERLATLNTILSEMDGVNTNGRLVVIGATNHPHMLDPALRRPGRFDFSVFIPLPDASTREGILQHYLGKEKTDGIDMKSVALRTQGYSGAQLKNIVLEAKRLAVREHGLEKEHIITQELLHRAQEIALLGINETTSNGHDLIRVAVHELGHALSGYMLCPDLYVEKVTVKGRGSALGYAVARPIEERKLVTKKQMHSRLVHYLSGRAAEDVVLGDVSGGAADDIKKANDLAREMVVNYGMGEKTGFSQPINAAGAFELTEDAKSDIQCILKSAYDDAMSIVGIHKEWLKSKTEMLMSLGVLSHEQLFLDVKKEDISFVSDEKWVGDVLVMHAEKVAHALALASEKPQVTLKAKEYHKDSEEE